MPGQPAPPAGRAGGPRLHGPRLHGPWSRTRRMAGGVLVDTGPLRRHGDFRRLWGGQLVSQVGTQLTIVAVSYQTYRLTGSTAMLGLVSLGQLVPLLAGSLIGGPLVDAWDRRRVMVFTQFMMIVQQVTPDGMQGRVNSLFYAGIQGGPRLGDAEAGAAAALGGPQFAAWTGGLLSVVTCWLLPGMWRYDSRGSRLPPAALGAGGQAEPDPIG